MRYPERVCVYTKDTFKPYLHVFSRLELETSGLDRRDHNHLTYMFDAIRQELLNNIDFKFNYQCLILEVY